jgi:hypothetical protein
MNYFSGLEVLAVLISALIIGGIFVRNNVMTPLFNAMLGLTGSKKLSLFCVSLVSGILPVEGRVTVSAPVLDSMHNKCCTSTRSKMGILDFVSTHHYYLWSPLEKSVLITMAGLGLTYSQFLQVTAIPILFYLGFLIYFISKYDADEIDVKPSDGSTSYMGFLFIAALVVSVWVSPVIVFPILALIYALYYKVEFLELVSYLRLKPILVVSGIVILANIVKQSGLEIKNFFEPEAFIGLIMLIGAGLSFLMGSSSKYAGITVAITTLIGIKYLPLVLMSEYIGYLLSPTHKCLAISMTYFDTKVKDFYKTVGALCFVLMLGGVLSYMFQ